MAPKYVSELLDKKKHNRADFSCGIEQLDNYLKNQAAQDAERNISKTYVFRLIDYQVIIGYFSLSTNVVETEQLPDAVMRRLPRYQALPAMLIGRLAISREHQGQGLGGILLINALQKCYHLSQEIGSVAVIVDAKDERAASFYERFGFQKFRDYQLKLFIPMKAIDILLKS